MWMAKKDLNASARICIHSGSSAIGLRSLHGSVGLYNTLHHLLCVFPKNSQIPWHLASISEGGTFLPPLNYCIQPTADMCIFSREIISIMLSTATVYIICFLCNMQWCYRCPDCCTYFPCKVLQDVHILHMAHICTFRICFEPSVSLVPAVACYAACPSWPSPKYKLWWFSMCLCKPTTGGLQSSVSNP